MQLNEGGNIWPNAESFDQRHVAQIKQVVDKYLAGTGLEVFPIGSAASPTPGKISGDLDVLVDLEKTMQLFDSPDSKTARIELEKFLQTRGLETRRIAVTVHVLVPFNGTYHQVDIKVVNKPERVAKFHTHSLPQNSPYKGVHKQMMMTALAIDKGMLWSPDEGLYKRDSAGKKAEFISDDLDEIAKVLLGPNANGRDFGSVESILSAIPDPQKRDQIFQNASTSRSWKPVQVQEAVQFGSSEWFRNLINTIL